jgi:hypothetical protein
MLHNPNAAFGRGAIAKFHIKRDTTCYTIPTLHPGEAASPNATSSGTRPGRRHHTVIVYDNSPLRNATGDYSLSMMVKRRRWHPTQRFRSVDGAVEMTMDLRGTVEVVSWVLGFGDKARVVEPAALRDAVAAEVAAMNRAYREA